MVQIGKINKLRVIGMQAYGLHLDGGIAGDVLLKGREHAGKYRPGDLLEAFVYVDREQRLLATVKKPYAMVGEFACLRVVASETTGAFLDWGLESDLFVPKSEQQDKMREGEFYVVYVFLHATTKRITASTKLKKFVSRQPPSYGEGTAVDFLVYSETDLGYRTIVNGSHIGMLYTNEVFQKLSIGQRLAGYVKKVREDGKIDLRLQQTGYQGVDDIAQTILDTIKENGGMVAVSDKSLPQDIYAKFGVSKKIFKKAIGALYKKRLIIIDSEGVKLA